MERRFHGKPLDAFMGLRLYSNAFIVFQLSCTWSIHVTVRMEAKMITYRYIACHLPFHNSHAWPENSFPRTHPLEGPEHYERKW